MVWVAWRQVAPQLGVAERRARRGREGRHADEGAGHASRPARRGGHGARVGLLGRPGSRRGARCVRRPAAGTARRRCASGRSCRRRRGPRRRCRGRAAPCRRPSRPTCRRSSARRCHRSRSTPRRRAARPASRPRTARSRRLRPVADAEHPQPVAGRVVGDPVREVGPDVGHAEHVDEELGQLVGPRPGLRHRRHQRGVADRSATIECWCRPIPAHEPDGVTIASYPANASDERPHHGHRLVQVAGVDHRLPAAGLRRREVDVDPETAQQPTTAFPVSGNIASSRRSPGGRPSQLGILPRTGAGVVVRRSWVARTVLAGRPAHPTGRRRRGPGRGRCPGRWPPRVRRAPRDPSDPRSPGTGAR